MNQLHILPHIDSDELASAYRRALDIPRDVAKKLGHSAVAASREGAYVNRSGERVDISGAVESACAARISIAPADPLPERERVRFPATRIQVSNESTFGASRRCKPVSVICPSSLQLHPFGVRRSEPSAAEPQRGEAAPHAQNGSRAGHVGSLLGCRQTHLTSKTIWPTTPILNS